MDELTTEINAISHRIWRIGNVVTGPGPERDRLLAEFNELSERKRLLVARRAQLLAQHPENAVSAEAC